MRSDSPRALGPRRPSPPPRHSPADKVVLLVAEDPEGHEVVAEAVLGDDLDGLDQGGAGRLVFVEQVPPQEHHVGVQPDGQAQDLLKRLE